jgi:hypothetical protein
VVVGLSGAHEVSGERWQRGRGAEGQFRAKGGIGITVLISMQPDAAGGVEARQGRAVTGSQLQVQVRGPGIEPGDQHVPVPDLPSLPACPPACLLDASDGATPLTRSPDERD